MKKESPVINLLPNLQDVTKPTVKLSEKSFGKTEKVNNFLSEIAKIFIFLSLAFKETFSRDFEFKEFWRQCFQIGYKSLPLISVTGTIMGLVLTIQSRPVLEGFRAVNMLPGMVAVSLIRELGPVITALICAGKVGSGMGAELGSMKVTEQIDAMEVSSINPMRFLVVTRVLAATFMIPLLVIYADALGILGCWAGINIKGDVAFVLFFSQAFSHVGFVDFFPAVIKTFFFGLVIGTVGCYKGFHAGRGTESVGRASNSEVISKQFAEIMLKINNGNGTLGRLIQDSSIAQNLEQTMENLKNSSKGLDENMKAAKESFLLKGYFRRKEKEAGKAMNDSTGIKSEEQKENNKKKK